MKKKPWKYVRFRNLQLRIEAYGYQYSFSKYIAMVLLGSLLIFLAGKWNGLRGIAAVILLSSFVLLLPILILEQFHYLYEERRFQSVVRYMEQMIYSFQKHPKILSALEETQQVLDGEIKERIQTIREEIEQSKGMDYKKAFQTIEKGYHCERLVQMHDFFIKVEEIGGQYQAALNAILDDLKMWTERTYLFQKERSQMKKKIAASILCVLLLCSVLFHMIIQSEEMKGILSSVPYQAGTTAILVSFLILFVFSQKILTGSWIKKEKELDWEQIKKDWMHVREEPDQYKRARKRLKREVEKQFPKWLRVVILGLQTDNVYRTIVESADDAPAVLRLPLQILIEDLGKDPVSMIPYDHFLKELEVPQIHSAVKMLYAYTNMGTSEAKEQLGEIMRRNTILTDRAERIQNEDEVAKYLLLFYVPMFLGTAKIMLDMSLLFIVMFSLWGKMTG
jgi:hypothetical protein